MQNLNIRSISVSALSANCHRTISDIQFFPIASQKFKILYFSVLAHASHNSFLRDYYETKRDKSNLT